MTLQSSVHLPYRFVFSSILICNRNYAASSVHASFQTIYIELRYGTQSYLLWQDTIVYQQSLNLQDYFYFHTETGVVIKVCSDKHCINVT